MTIDLYASLVTDDARREAIIEYYEAQMQRATTKEAKRFWWTLLAREINNRAAGQVAKMENEAGLK